MIYIYIYIVVQTARSFLNSNGFRELFEDELWSVQPMDKIFVTKNESTLIAAAVGHNFDPLDYSKSAFTMFGAHTDSPCLRLKPNSFRSKEGYIQLGVETYGGGLWYTWFDRDLSVAGRVMVRSSNSQGFPKLEQRFVHINRPICCVSSLAIHLNKELKDNTGFKPNLEQHISPILCTNIMDQVMFVCFF